MIIDIAGARVASSVCIGSPVIIKVFTKKLANKYVHEKLEFSTRAGTITHR